MTEDDLVMTEDHGAVRVIRLADERRLNALSFQMRRELSSSLHAVADDPDVRALYITGSGRAFCSGGDLRLLHEEGDAWTSHQRLDWTSRWLADLVRCPKPVVVGINGIAVGGGIGIAVAGDIVYAGAQKATFQSGFLRLGLIPDMGMMYSLPRLVGLARAKSFIYEQACWTAQQAADYGLITASVPDDQLEQLGLQRASELAAGPIEGFGLTKRLMARSFESSLEEMMLLEDFGQSLAHTTESAREGVAAMIDRRTADFAAATERENAVRLERSRLQQP
jgi:2-(1,2-epoxy-1,2-dihydrophenyl)acetyl-CoA isomerase